MGNFLATSASIGVPLFNNLVTVPYIFHPDRLGGMPWSEPSWIWLAFVTAVVNIITLMFLGTISGLMTTKKKCGKVDLFKSFHRSLWIVMGYFIGNTVLFMAPFIKAPLLPFMVMIPYGGWIVHGILVAISILFFGATGNAILRNEVCK